MAWFPLFQNPEGKTVLIIGGGKVALRKAEKLLPFRPSITVIAPEILPQLEAMELTAIHREFRDEDIASDVFCVIAACADRETNRRIALACQAKSIPVNVVDDPSLCTFLFPSLVKKGPLTVGISTSGSSPTAAVWVREMLEQLIPDSMEEILLWLQQQREPIQAALPTLAERTACQRKLFAACMEQAGPLSPEQRDVIIASSRNNENESRG